MRLSKYLDFNKLRIPLKTFNESQFKYCLLTWICYSRHTNNKINKLHERAYDDYTSTFEELLEKDNSFTVDHYNIHALFLGI